MGWKLRGAAAAAALLMVVAMSGTASAAPLVQRYNSIPKHLPGNVASVGFEATQASELGDEVMLTGAGALLKTVRVIMSSWGCESGTWYNNDCLTTPGATFPVPITLNIYAGNGGPTPGALLATQTRTFDIKYRPSANGGKCFGAELGEYYSKKGHSCFNGAAQSIGFSFPTRPANVAIALPQDVVWTVAYNTTHYGYASIGEGAPCFGSSGGCGYDSLNVGTESFDGQPNHGSDVDVNGIYWNTATAGNYCDGGAGGVGTLRLDTDPGACGWANYRPMATIRTKG